MYVGKFNRIPCVTSPSAPNSSVCITGICGTGKTSRLNMCELESAKAGKTVLVLDMTQTHLPQQIFSPIRQEYETYANRIVAVKDGLEVSFLKRRMNSSGEQEPEVTFINSAVEALCAGQNMGVRQIGALRQAVCNAIHSRWKYCTEMEAIAKELLYSESNDSDTVYKKLWTVLNSGVLRASQKKIYVGRINIIDFSGLDGNTQCVLAELVLLSLWRCVRLEGPSEKNDKFVLSLDEFQNLSMKRNSVFRTMLAEGRRFGIALLMATQTMERFPKEIRSLINLNATHLFFRPSRDDARRIARGIAACSDREQAQAWEQMLLELKVGEAIGIGDFFADGREIRRPILLK